MRRDYPDDAPCPCGSAQPYARCCGPLLAGQPAPTAELLMRSRYTAFALHDAPYLLESWHSRTRPPNLNVPADGEWIGLKILDTQAGGPDDDEGVVEFVARYKYQGSTDRMHERSRFLREDGRWRYLDGEHRARDAQPAARGRH